VVLIALLAAALLAATLLAAALLAATLLAATLLRRAIVPCSFISGEWVYYGGGGIMQFF